MCGGMSPFAIDAYIAGFPEIASELSTSASGVQLTLTGFMVALGFFQLVIGPLSDQVGRRRLLLLGLAGAGVAAIACALAPTIEVLVVARLVQGAFGAAAVVLARAILADLGRGIGLARAFALLMAIQSIAPVLAPGIGGVLIAAFGWRSTFWFLAVIPALLVVAVLALVPETLPPERRRASGFGHALRDMGTLLVTPSYRTSVTMFVAAFATMFAYVAGSSFVLQNVVGFTQAQYSIAFTTNAVGLLVSSLLSGRVVGGRTEPFRVVRIAGAIQSTAVVWLAVCVLLLGVPAWGIVAGFFVLVCATGFMLPSLSALAIEAAGARTGSGAAMLGASQMFAAAAAAPLTGLGDGRSAVPMVLVMLVTSAVLTGAFVHASHRRRRDAT